MGEQLLRQASKCQRAEVPKSFTGHNALPSAMRSESLVLQGQEGLGHPCNVMFVSINWLATPGLEAGANSVAVTLNILGLRWDAAVAKHHGNTADRQAGRCQHADTSHIVYLWERAGVPEQSTEQGKATHRPYTPSALGRGEAGWWWHPSE